MKSFPYPLPPHALDEFIHPAAGHLFSKAVRHDGEILAGNGYMMMRATRGRWLDRDFPLASVEYLERLGKIPWARWQHLRKTDWRAWNPHFNSAPMGIWLKDRVAPCPVWRVGAVLVRVSMLQLIARLPRVEVAWTADSDSPLWFRFSGGRGAVAYDRRLTLASFSMFQPQVDVLNGGTLRRETHPRPSFSLPGWPPADLSES